MTAMETTSAAIIDRSEFDGFIEAIRKNGFTVVGPQARDGVIQYGEIETSDDLPAGWVDHQEAGRYRLENTDDPRLFAHTLGPQSWKPFLFPPRLSLFRTRQADGDLELDESREAPPKLAFLGVRACDLAAIAVQDRVFMGGNFVDPTYAERRESVCLSAVNCHRPAATCFCASTGTGPRAIDGFDLALTEMVGENEHGFLVETGSELGEHILESIPNRPATGDDWRRAAEVSVGATDGQQRSIDLQGARGLLLRKLDSPQWQEIANRCLSCGNCTMVCPTCFCSSVEDTTDLSGEVSERTRRWESCFSASHSYIHGGSVHASGASRYRQWMTHKFTSWWDQFGSSGCVGCGRCITWCPVGIDITAELVTMQSEEISHDRTDASTRP